MKVYWTNRAVLRLKLIHRYIAEDSPQVALNVIDRVTSRSQQLSESPHSGRRVPEYDQNDIRELIEKPYRIIYRIKSNQIDVLTIMHNRQLLPHDIKQI